MKIGRTLFWFIDGNEKIINHNDDFFALSVLLNRLLNEKYDGPRIKFINIEFSTLLTYEMFPGGPQDEPYYYGGHLLYYGVFNRAEFESQRKEQQQKFLWEKAYEYLKKSAQAMKNKHLSIATEYAYDKGLEMDLNPDYRELDIETTIHGQHIRASVWFNFKEDGIYSKFTVESSGGLIYEKAIDKTRKGIEIFLELYYTLEAKDDRFIIRGDSEVSYLPMEIPFSDVFK